MSRTLTAVIADPPSGRRRAVLFDHHDYAQRIILQGRDVPWDDAMAYSNFYGQAQALLKPDVALLDLGRFYAHRLAVDPGLGEAMAERPRTGFALRTLLGHPETARQALHLTTTFTKTQRAPVVLRIPSPMQWLGQSHHFSGAPQTDGLDADDAEKASMYVADWLRAFAELEVAGVLLDDRHSIDGHLASVELSTYSPVANVAENYRWTLGMQHEDRVELRGHGMVGAMVKPGFWGTGSTELPNGDFLVAEIPPSAVPEDVLARIAMLE